MDFEGSSNMRSPRDFRPNTFLSRLAVYGAAVWVSSMIGSLFVRVYGHWQDPGLWGPIYFAVFSLGPALGVVAAAKLSTPAVIVVAVVAASGMLVLWWLFASNDSSTSVFAFFMGWFVGIPIATVILATVEFRSRGERPTESDPSAQ